MLTPASPARPSSIRRCAEVVNVRFFARLSLKDVVAVSGVFPAPPNGTGYSRGRYTAEPA